MNLLSKSIQFPLTRDIEKIYKNLSKETKKKLKESKNKWKMHKEETRS